jgi:hypothetical protein
VRAELLPRAGAELAEGPLSLTDGTLAWVDILRDEIPGSTASTARCA